MQRHELVDLGVPMDAGEYFAAVGENSVAAHINGFKSELGGDYLVWKQLPPGVIACYVPSLAVTIYHPDYVMYLANQDTDNALEVVDHEARHRMHHLNVMKGKYSINDEGAVVELSKEATGGGVRHGYREEVSDTNKLLNTPMLGELELENLFEGGSAWEVTMNIVDRMIDVRINDLDFDGLSIDNIERMLMANTATFNAAFPRLIDDLTSLEDSGITSSADIFRRAINEPQLTEKIARYVLMKREDELRSAAEKMVSENSDFTMNDVIAEFRRQKFAYVIDSQEAHVRNSVLRDLFPEQDSLTGLPPIQFPNHNLVLAA